jgi:protein SCO1
MKLRLFPLVLAFASVALAQHANTGNYRGGLVTPPLPKPRFVLTDTSGGAFDFGQRTEGYVTLLFFGYTNCPDECPMHMSNLGAALKKLPASVADQVRLVFVTTDPARDSPAVLRHWLDLFDRHFIGLTGTERAIEAVERAAGAPLATKTGTANSGYGVTHANFVFAYSKDNFAHLVYPGGVSQADWVHDLPLLINQTWRNQ